MTLHVTSQDKICYYMESSKHMSFCATSHNVILNFAVAACNRQCNSVSEATERQLQWQINGYDNGRTRMMMESAEVCARKKWKVVDEKFYGTEAILTEMPCHLTAGEKIRCSRKYMQGKNSKCYIIRTVQFLHHCCINKRYVNPSIINNVGYNMLGFMLCL